MLLRLRGSPLELGARTREKRTVHTPRRGFAGSFCRSTLQLRDPTELESMKLIKFILYWPVVFAGAACSGVLLLFIAGIYLLARCMGFTRAKKKDLETEVSKSFVHHA